MTVKSAVGEQCIVVTLFILATLIGLLCGKADPMGLCGFSTSVPCHGAMEVQESKKSACKSA